MREDGRVLAIQRADNATWEPPGGVLEIEEAPEEGVRREIQEETGILAQVDQLTGVYKNMSRGVIALFFHCTVSGGEVRTSDESRAVAWLTPEEVSEKMGEVYAVRVLDALSSDAPHVRSHDGRKLLRAG